MLSVKNHKADAFSFSWFKINRSQERKLQMGFLEPA